ncbi:GmrSD restriction endonuclease domain-containing protein [Corynebacterium sp. AOP40-9SA-29]|uniref:GmrSD restriction endonuclease domain-containing protein n=1 Tax=Corynebacterium sp. AOP40-9SA-29 TaxID=3457677 RepID=UPI004034BB0D
MAGTDTSFEASAVKLSELLGNAEKGQLQLPDFQRGWVWDEERIRALIASVSRGFPVGAVMTLRTGGNVTFKPRPVEGASPASDDNTVESLLLDGQQRLTSLFQVMKRKVAVSTVTPRGKPVDRWFYLDIEKCLDDECDREDAVIVVPADKRVTSDFGRSVDIDVTTREKEFENKLFPLNEIFSWTDWQQGYFTHVGTESMAEIFNFNDRVISNFTEYLVPQIRLAASTTKEAVCVVFEKVNTGGKPLDAFELVTAMYAAEGHELRKDWYGSESSQGRKERLSAAHRLPTEEVGVLGDVGNTDFLQAISLFHSRGLRDDAAKNGRTGKDLPKISATRKSLLDLPLEAYLKYQDEIEEGFFAAAKFLVNLGIYRVKDLPYQSQVVPLAAILADLGQRGDSPAAQAKVKRWFWNGVFGELYGSSTETRIAHDFVEVVRWIDGEKEPSTVHDATVRADRLESMRSRSSAAYKGVNALLTYHGARDFRTGQSYGHTIFFDENVDIHHIFPKDWCKKNDIPPAIYDSIINKTPLSSRTNRIIGGVAPSRYLQTLEAEFADDANNPGQEVDERLRSHLVDPGLLRADHFYDFMKDRQRQLVSLIEGATEKRVIVDAQG